MRACSVFSLFVLIGIALAGNGGIPGAGQAVKRQKAAPRTDPATVVDAQSKAAMAGAPKSSDFPDSDAVCLLDLSDVTLRPDGTVVETVRKTFKLFNQRARSLAEINLPYNSGRERLAVIAARTIKANGTVVRVRDEDMRLSSPGREFAMYGDAASTGFSMPAIEDNCIIDYTYEKTTSSSLLSGQYADTWSLSGRYPVALSRLTLHAGADKPLRYRLCNDDVCKPVVSAGPKGLTKTYVFERRDVEPLVPEPMMPFPMRIAPHVEVSTIGSWDTIGHWYFGLQQPQAKATPAITSTVAGLIAGKATEAAKATAIYDWVAGDIRYIGLALGASAYRPHPASEVFAKRYGDGKDKTNLLIAMLGAAGIHADPVLLYTGNPVDQAGRLPSLQAFNHCIAVAKIDGKEVWLDAAAVTCPYGDIPANDRSTYGLVISSGGSAFQRIPAYLPAENGMVDRETVALNADGSAELRIGWSFRATSRRRSAFRCERPPQRSASRLRSRWCRRSRAAPS